MMPIKNSLVRKVSLLRRPKSTDTPENGGRNTPTHRTSKTYDPPQLPPIKFGAEAEGIQHALPHSFKQTSMTTVTELPVATLEEEEDENPAARPLEPPSDALPPISPAHASKPKGLKKITSLLHINSARTPPASLRTDSPTPLKRTLPASLEILASSSTPSTAQSSPRPQTFSSSLHSIPDADSQAHPDTPATGTSPNASAADISLPADEEKDEAVPAKQHRSHSHIPDVSNITTPSVSFSPSHSVSPQEFIRTLAPSKRLTRLLDRLALPNPFCPPHRSHNLDGEDGDANDGAARAHEGLLAERAAMRRAGWEEALRKRVTVVVEVWGEDGVRGVGERGRYDFVEGE